MDKSISVLVVDDEVEICMLLSGMLKKKGCSVDCAHSLKDARELLQRTKYKLIFLDLNLPDGLGFRLIKDTSSSQEEVKIVIISAYDGNVERKRADSEGVDYFLPKPFNRAAVFDVLEHIDIPID